MCEVLTGRELGGGAKPVCGRQRAPAPGRRILGLLAVLRAPGLTALRVGRVGSSATARPGVGLEPVAETGQVAHRARTRSQVLVLAAGRRVLLCSCTRHNSLYQLQLSYFTTSLEFPSDWYSGKGWGRARASSINERLLREISL